MSTNKGTLILNVLEASGLNKQDYYVWDHLDFSGWVKVELRGGPTNVKVQTQPTPLNGQALFWKQVLQLEVAEGANELRLMLCKEKISPEGRKGVSVIAACGIYVDQILENVPIDKYFELFKPNGGGEGGYIRIGIDFHSSKSDSEASPAPAAGTGVATNGTSAAAPAKPATTPAKKKKSGPFKLLFPLLVIAAGAAGFVYTRKQKEKKQ